MQELVVKDRFIDYLKEAPNFLSNFILPFYFTTASTMLIEISAEFNVTSADIGLIFTFFVIGSVLGQLTSVIYNRRFKKIVVVASSYIIITMILIGLIFTKDLILFFILYLLMGYFCGVILIQATKYLLENKVGNKDRITLIFLSFYPLGSLTAPFLAAYLVRNNINWRYSFAILAVATVIILSIYILIKARKDSLAQDTEERIGLKALFSDSLKNRIFIFGLALIFFYSIAETVMATWSPTFLRMAKGFDVTSAGFAVTAFWLGILIGRVLASFIAGRKRLNIILIAFSLIWFSAMIFFIIAKSPAAIIIFSAIAGFGSSAILPLSISSTSTIYEKGRGILVSVVFAVNNAAISLTPLLTRSISGWILTLSVVLAPLTIFLGVSVVVARMIYEKRKSG